MNENLIPLRKGEQRTQEIVRLGGSKKTEKKTYSLLITASGKCKCKNCRVDCCYKNDMLIRDEESICIVPTMRAKALWYKTSIRAFNSEVLSGYLNELLNLYYGLYRKEKTDKGRMEIAEKLFNKLILVKEKLFPVVQQFQIFNVELIKRIDEVIKKDDKELIELREENTQLKEKLKRFEQGL